ncbi:Sas10/Utp3/C1D family-domain-containing protein [Suillus paluster]|uniref:Sas10/Utp3/C1D family-domain-containing protein n=1 Tax=Suillus paluster TaxID=48578 RepID=UPI001B88560B|nr:Sas10/Utp3/C1D family-domain-containing protein [Suillus paluster]KAG1754756.1 Sas10/Utp3/C1D family-domain-containing protein [Suillus paluster]
MASDEDRLRAKVANLNASLDELEMQLEPLFTKSLAETLVALETIQQAKLQVVLPYVLYDLVFVYLKTRGIDPRTHPVIAELDRVRQYFDKIKHAEESEEKSKLGIDKAAAGRFIKHAIAQAKLVKPVEESSNNASPGPATTSERVPVKITSKMAERAEYEKNLEELGSEEEEDLEVFDEAEVERDEDAMEDEVLSPQDKGKSRMVENEVPERGEQLGGRRKRPRIDPFTGSLDVFLFCSPKLTHPQDMGMSILQSPRNRKRSHPHHLPYLAPPRLLRHQISQDKVLYRHPTKGNKEKQQRKSDERRRSC